MNKQLKKNISLALLSASIFSTTLCTDIESVYAASSQNIRQTAAGKDIYNPNIFTEKIKKIIKI